MFQKKIVVLRNTSQKNSYYQYNIKTMKKILQIAFYVLGFIFCFLIYRSITGPIEFNKVKEERYTEVIKKLKDIRNVQDAYLKIKGTYASNFDELTNFIETAQYTIISQRDTSWTEFDKSYNIEVMRQGVRIDTLGHVKVKDSLFKNDLRYKDLRSIQFGKNPPIDFVMKTGVLEDKNKVKSAVFEVYVEKKDVLKGLDNDLITKEISKNSVDDVKGATIKVGSLEELTVNGNWPTSYDAKIAKE